MKKLVLLLTLIVFSLDVFAQNAYEENIKKANEGDMVAQNQIGLCYEYGYGVAKDQKMAFSWYMKAAEQGYPRAQGNVGNCYFCGRGIKQDFNLAILWFKKAAEQGNAASECNLGFCYNNGYGVEKDIAKAVFWYRKAAEHGDPVAQNNLAICYKDGYGVEKDLPMAIYWFRKSAEQGNAGGQANLGSCYFKGEGVEKDLYQAEYWIGKAAEQGNAWAIDLIPQVLSKINEHENEKRELEKMSSPSKSVDVNIPTSNTIDKNCYAVIIGNEKYQNEVEVPFAENDASVFKEYVKHTLGVPDRNIRYIANGTLNGIRIAVKWLAQAMEACGGNAQALFYYAGHGIPDEASKSAYLLPVDGIGSDPESAYSLNRLYGEFEHMQAKRVMVFLDACFSGSKREEGMLASARGVAIKAKLAVPNGNMIIFTAAQGDETAYPYKDQRHGLFTYFLLKKLKETKGDVTLGDLADYLQDEVKRQSFIENKKMQTPTVTASQSVASSWKNIKLK